MSSPTLTNGALSKLTALELADNVPPNTTTKPIHRITHALLEYFRPYLQGAAAGLVCGVVWAVFISLFCLGLIALAGVYVFMASSGLFGNLTFLVILVILLDLARRRWHHRVVYWAQWEFIKKWKMDVE